MPWISSRSTLMPVHRHQRVLAGILAVLTAGCAAPRPEFASVATAATTFNGTIGHVDDDNARMAQAVARAPSSVRPLTSVSAATATASTSAQTTAAANPAVTSEKQYSFIDPQHLIDRGLLKTTLAYFAKNKSEFSNQNYLGVIDYAKPSNEDRLFIVNLKTGLVWALPVAHGKGSDPKHTGVAKLFSDLFGSNSTSLGFFRTADTYVGENGLSLKLDGLSPSNTHARERKIVIHGADYVQEGRALQGRSWGCPAVPMQARDNVISFLKNGSLLYAGLGSENLKSRVGPMATPKQKN